MAKEIYEVIQALQSAGEAFAIATVVETRGSVSAKTSSKAVIDSEGRVVACWVGGCGLGKLPSGQLPDYKRPGLRAVATQG